MTFEEWFERQFGKRPSYVHLAAQKEAARQARERAKAAEEEWRASDNWERQRAAASITWNALKKKDTP